MDRQHLFHATVAQCQHALLMNQTAIALIKRRRRRRRRPRRYWVRPWLSVPRRLQFGNYNQLLQELRLEDESAFHNYLRMEPAMFDEILGRVGPRIAKLNTNFRASLEPGLKLAITLRFLATGDRYTSLQYQYRVSLSAISKFVPEVCRAIREEYKEEVVQCPTNPQEWQTIADDFYNRWNVPHACGAIDGKHVAVRCPPNTGSLYHNYKGFFSVVLLALVDANYKFLWCDVGGFGTMSDSQIFNESELKQCLEDGTINFPAPSPLPHDDQDTPFFFLGDDAFALRTYMMKPYSSRGLTKEQQIFNYRASRARRAVENAFGILAQRFQVLLSTMQMLPEAVQDVIEACICLHNLMRDRYPALQNAALDNEDENHNLVPGQWRQETNMHDVEQVVGPNRATRAGKQLREYLKLYFNSAAGSVPWQDRMI
ncbi:putative nuclease HARBI1 [Lingula anatina]|uniref:Nuclease HARBI1 n=1 Tax=Lingula anatina TaxID=7574 RepID=A0A1S3HK57_LINAN|nr:putative nuclease HARBI1 [Lingula anatina]|eukprot:XP_013386500.1 putative nuclease HARBI1 [Lingula anatina]